MPLDRRPGVALEAIRLYLRLEEAATEILACRYGAGKRADARGLVARAFGPLAVA